MPFFLRTLIPNSTRRAPGALLSNMEATAALQAFSQRSDILQIKTPMNEAISMLEDSKAMRHSQRLFEESCQAFRNELYLTSDTNAFRRLALHETLMAAGFYARATNMHNPTLDAVRFVLNHYNFDMRRDSHLVRQVHDSVLSAEETPQADDLAKELLQLERYLFGQHRLRPIGGKQFLTLGVDMAEFKDEKMLEQVLDLPVIKAWGNFSYQVRDEVRQSQKGSQAVQERWKIANVRCAPEPEDEEHKIFSQELMEAKVATAHGKIKSDYDLRFLLPAPIVPFWERVKLFLLDAWVYFFGAWVLFWLVDEEIIGILAILYTRYHSRKTMTEEAKKAGGSGKIYIAAGKWH